MKTVTPTQLRADLYSLLDEVLKTGVPLHVKRRDQILKIEPLDKPDKLANLILRPECIQGNPDDLADIHWETEVDFDLP